MFFCKELDAVVVTLVIVWRLINCRIIIVIIRPTTSANKAEVM